MRLTAAFALVAVAALGCVPARDNALVAAGDGTKTRVGFNQVVCIRTDEGASMRASTTSHRRELTVLMNNDDGMTLLLDVWRDDDHVVRGNLNAVVSGLQGTPSLEAGYQDLPISRDGDSLTFHRVLIVNPREDPLLLSGTLRCTRGHL